MNVLGLNCSSWHDPSAALLVDGRVVAAAEQERFSRTKHARGRLPIEAARFCLDAAGLRPDEVDVVAHPWSMDAIRDNRLAFARRAFGRQSLRSIAGFLRRRGHRRRRELRKLHDALRGAGIDPERVEIAEVEHHRAHAASAYAFSRFDECAVATIDGTGEITSALFGSVSGGRLTKLFEIQRPDSLGMFYTAITDYLGFEPDDGEYKVMGMAPYGRASEVDLSDIVQFTDGDLRVNRDLIVPSRDLSYEGRRFGKGLVERFGKPREGDILSEPYIHIAAAAQEMLERAAIALIETHLGDELRRTGRLCLAGGCALNVVLNRRLIEHPLVEELFVPPAPNDAGLPLGAAALATMARGIEVQPLEHAYWGPEYDDHEIANALETFRIPHRRLADPALAAASLLARGEIVGWFQGRMEWGPRALGNRSILGHPGIPGTERDINLRIKFREGWRPFCPSVLEEYAADVLGSTHPCPFMTYSFRLPQAWKQRIPEVTHVDGTARPQVVSAKANPLFHALIAEFMKRTDLPCVINTSLNRRGEPMITSPKDALQMFYGCGLEHLVVGRFYVSKNPTLALPQGLADS